MSTLREALRERIERDRLSEERLAALEALQAQAERSAPMPAPVQVSQPRRRSWRWAIAALPVAALLLGLWWWQLPIGELSDAARLARIADEVAGQHLHLKPLEVHATDMAEVRRYLRQLDFLPVPSNAPALAGLRLQGGRYCSLQGAPAAQLRLRPDDGEIGDEGEGVQTLYQARYDPERFGALPDRERDETPALLRARGLEVLLWVERGVVFALVRDD